MITAAIVLVLVGCTERNPRFCGDGTCTDPSLPFCDTDGSFSDTPGTCIAVACSPGTFEACRGDDTLVCNSDGSNYDVMHCDTGCKVGVITCNPCKPGTLSCGDDAVATCGDDGLPHPSETCDVGCVDSPAPHCGYVEPKYLPDICDAPATVPELNLINSTTLSTDTDANCNGGIVPQDAAPDLCVLRYGTIEITANATLQATGSRALVLVADASITINGGLDISSHIGARGAGGGIGNPGNGASTTSPNSGGGGGAGFATKGGNGGGGLAGGSASTNPALLTGLIGGAVGGNSASGAGGAVALVACRGAVVVGTTGTINAGGEGGAPRIGFPLSGAQGGGSGGTIVMEGLAIDVRGFVAANGGGGGEAATNGATGQDGGFTTTPALGGGTGATQGGNGGCRDSAPTNGATGSITGGGGGSAGFLQTYTPQGVLPSLTPLLASPAFQQNLVVPTR